MSDLTDALRLSAKFIDRTAARTAAQDPAALAGYAGKLSAIIRDLQIIAIDLDQAHAPGDYGDPARIAADYREFEKITNPQMEGPPDVSPGSPAAKDGDGQ